MPTRDELSRVDLVVAASLTLVGLAEAVLGLTAGVQEWYVVASVPFATMPVALRRSRATACLVVVLVVLLGQAAAGSDLGGGFAEGLALVLVVYSVGSRTDTRRAVLLLVVALAATAGVVALAGETRPGNFVYACTVVAVSWMAGRGVRLADERSRLLAERSAARERGRIARELHDVVAHNVSAIVVQAAAERRDLGVDDPAARTLADVEEQGRQTLVELRRLLGLLRTDPDERLDAPRAPQPGIADIPRLVESMRSSGVHATLTTYGDPVPVSYGLELAVYRVVQEGLTNVRKHASSPRAADVAVRWDAAHVEVEVVNAGGRADGSVPGTGYGLVAMRERVRAYGGRVLSAGPTRDGFRVHVALPTGEPS